MPVFKAPETVKLPKIGGIYRHYKGTEYVVKDITRDSETKETRIIYYDDPSEVPWDRLLLGTDKDGKLCGWADISEDPLTGVITHRFTSVYQDGKSNDV